MTKMIRRSSGKPWSDDLNRFLDVVLGNTEGRISLLDDSGDELDLIDGTVVSSNNYSQMVRSAAGRHGLYQHSNAVTNVLDIRDTGITVVGTFGVTGNTTLTGNLAVTGVTLLNGNVTLGDNAADTLTVEAVSTFKANASFLVNVTIGDAAGDTLTVNSTPTFNAGLIIATGVLAVPAGTNTAPSIAIGDNDTGLYLSAAGTVGTTINGTLRSTMAAGGLSLIGADVLVDNLQAYRVKESGGTIRNAVQMDASDILQVGVSGMTGAYLNSGDTRLQSAGTTRIQVNSDGIGFFATAPVAQPAAGAAATDPATTQTLANALRTGLRDLGLFS